MAFTSYRRSTIALLLLLGLLSLAVVSPRAGAANNVRGSRHDFRAPVNGGKNLRYPNLANLAGANPCAACHTSHNAAGGSLAPADFGLKLNHTMQDASLKCLSCHDGVIETPDGNDVLPSNKRLSWHWHKVEFTYPPQSGHGMAFEFGFRPLVHDAENRMYVPIAGPGGLPLSNESSSQRAKATCVTCHDPHNPGRDGRFLRTGSQNGLCAKCHSFNMM